MKCTSTGLSAPSHESVSLNDVTHFNLIFKTFLFNRVSAFNLADNVLEHSALPETWQLCASWLTGSRRFSQQWDVHAREISNNVSQLIIVLSMSQLASLQSPQYVNNSSQRHCQAGDGHCTLWYYQLNTRSFTELNFLPNLFNNSQVLDPHTYSGGHSCKFYGSLHVPNLLLKLEHFKRALKSWYRLS